MNKVLKQAQITLLGLGSGGMEHLTGEAHAWLSGCSEVYTRMSSHPVLAAFSDKLVVHGFDDLYEYGASLQEIHEQIVTVILEIGKNNGQVTYAVPGHPLVGDATCAEIRKRAGALGMPVRVIEGISYLESVCACLDIGECEKLMVIDGFELRDHHIPPFSPALPALVTQLGHRAALQEIRNLLLAIYPPEHRVMLVHQGKSDSPVVEQYTLGEVDQSEQVGILSGLYLPAISTDASFEALQEVVARLRAPGGCPWDREQTHQTLRSSLLEETYETLAALDLGDTAAMCEELGDLVMQIVMHAQIAREAGEFTMVDVLQGIHRKLVRRHPHVFGDVAVKGTEDVLVNWEKLKEKERSDRGEKRKKGMLDGVPKDYPALAQAQEYQKRVRRVGFDWPDIDGVMDKVREELAEFQEATNEVTKTEELGDLLFSVVNLARWLGIDAESALRTTNLKFMRRFQYIERRAEQSGRRLSDMTLEEMDRFWDEAKRLE